MNCGVKHTWDNGDYLMDQTDYIAALKPNTSSSLTGRPSDDRLSEPETKLFLSLLMVLSYALQTRVDLCVYVVALQRVPHEPTVLHLKRLNALVRWAQKHSLQIRYRAMKCAQELEAPLGCRIPQGGEGRT